MPPGEHTRASDEPSGMLDAADHLSRRFWLPRGNDPDDSDDGFLVDPESRFVRSSAVPLEAIVSHPVLILLGEPGMGKSTALRAEYERVWAISGKTDRISKVDLGLYRSDALLDQRIFKSKRFRSRRGAQNFHVFFDGFDECFQSNPNLAGLLLEFLEDLRPNTRSIRIACRTADWSMELESGLAKLWGENSVGVYQLAPLRRADVYREVVRRGLSPDEFLTQVAQLSAGPLASRPITLRFMLDSLGRGAGLPSRSTDLYYEGCRVLCDEWRERPRRVRRLSAGERFAVASRMAAVVIFGDRPAIDIGPRRGTTPEEDIRSDELLGGAEFFGREKIKVSPRAMKETLDTGLFRSVGRHRLGFSHQTYAEYLAAQYLVDGKLPVTEILRLVLHEDGSAKVVPQLRGAAGWLASLLPEVCHAILEKDPESLLLAGDLLLAEEDRANLVRQILRSYDSGVLFNEHLIRGVGSRLGRARFKYPGLADDLRPYIRDSAKGVSVRRIAISIADLASQTSLQHDIADVALNETEPHAVRTMAAFALGRIGDEGTKARLKCLATDKSLEDPDDELKGAALLATWPNHLTAEELFSALSRPKKGNTTGLYQQFLWSDIASTIRLRDMCTALDWAQRHVNGSPAEINPLQKTAWAVVTASVAFFQEPDICERVADISVSTQYFVHPERFAAALHANTPARRAIAKVAIRKAPDYFGARQLARMGLISPDDSVFLLSLFSDVVSTDEESRIALLIRDILFSDPSIGIDIIDEVIAVTRTKPAVCEMLRPILGTIEWPSAEADQLRVDYEATVPRKTPPEPELSQQMDELLSSLTDDDLFAFEKVCWRLLGDSSPSQSQNDELLPRWSSLQPATQGRIVDLASAYLRGGCPVTDLSWIETHQMPYRVMYGFWALRLLSANAPTAFSSISPESWGNWMPCAFGDPYMDSVVDVRHKAVLKTAYRFARDRFLEVLRCLIEGQNKTWGAVYVLDRILPIWDDDIAQSLRSWLLADGIKPRAFQQIADVLIERNDVAAIQTATEVVTAVNADREDDFDVPVAAALALVCRNPVEGWQVAWRAVEINSGFAEALFANLALDPFSKITSDVVQHLGEDQLADMYIWLSRQGAISQEENTFGLMTPIRALTWLARVVINHLGSRGTPAASEQVRRIRNSLPDQQLDFLSKSTEELVRRRTWRPLSPLHLIELASSFRKAPQTPDTGLRMKLDLNLMRGIVLAVEDTAGLVAHNQPSVDGYSRDQIGYHIHVLIERGLARGINVTNMGNADPQALITGLTAEGHEFAGLARDDDRWRNATAVAEGAGVVTFDYVKHLLADPGSANVSPQDQAQTREDAERGKERSAWLDAKCGENKWTSDLEIQNNGGPAYNTIDRFRSGKISTRDRYVRQKFADLFGCALNDVPK
jgi:Hypothetical protein (DUF2513)